MTLLRFRCLVITEDDFHTYELTLKVRRNLCELFGGICPAAILNRLVRAKFDANRNKPEATFNVPEAMCAFLKYQSDIGDAKSVITRYNEVGLFIDIHGQSHTYVLTCSFHHRFCFRYCFLQ